MSENKEKRILVQTKVDAKQLAKLEKIAEMFSCSRANALLIALNMVNLNSIPVDLNYSQTKESEEK
jgi:hypothetical protein